MKEQDCLRRFLFEELGVRGEWVRLQTSWEQAKQYQQLSEGVQEKLAKQWPQLFYCQQPLSLRVL